MGDDKHEQHHNVWLELQKQFGKIGQRADSRFSPLFFMSIEVANLKEEDDRLRQSSNLNLKDTHCHRSYT